MLNAIKHWLEKPGFVFLAVAAAYVALFFGHFRFAEPRDAERESLGVVTRYAEAPFPPPIDLIRNHPDWGRLGYHALAGRVAKVAARHAAHGTTACVRGLSLAFMLLAFLVFARLGARYTLHNRLNPLWISAGLLLFAANPYALQAAMRADALPMLLFLLLAALLAFAREDYRWASFFLSAAVLVDWRALALAAVFAFERLAGDRSRLLRPERGFALALPFAVAALPLVAWKGLIPLGEAREWWEGLRARISWIHPEALFYFFALLPVYAAVFSWNWGFRARVRALAVGAVAAAVCIPLYFVFPLRHDDWLAFRHGMEVPLGLLDEAARALAGEYKNLVLFPPFLVGAFLFLQLVLRDILDASRLLRSFLVLLFAAQLFVGGLGAAPGASPGIAGDRGFLVALPFILLFSLSETLVGEEGKLI